MKIMKENKKIGISFGVMSDSLSKQLKDQGFRFDNKKAKVFEKEIDAINQLRFGSHLLTDSIVDKLFGKLYKKIVAHVAAVNKLSILK